MKKNKIKIKGKMRKIKVVELQKLFKEIISKLQEENIKEITFETDLYQIIPTHIWHEFGKEKMNVGSLFDDVDSLKKVLEDKDSIMTYVDLDRVASVLREISEIQNPVVRKE